jgi:hypothetical protein
MKRTTPDPLPPEWLPDPVGPVSGGDSDAWDRRLRELMNAAEPRLAELARQGADRPAARVATPWWTLLAARWRAVVGAAVLAAAALALVVRVLPAPSASAARSPGAFSLTAMAGQGSAAAVWQGLGSEADPTLAQIVLQGASR